METLSLLLLGALIALIGVVAINRLRSFASQKPADYAGTGPDFDIRTELNGAMICEGVIYGPTGRVAARFVADMFAKWDGNVGSMTEDFRYDDGSTQHRRWTLEVDDTGRIKATAPDIIGAGLGTQTGPAVQLNYRIKLRESSGGHVLDTVDWMYLMENGTIINRSQFRKFGVRVAELVATMRPANASREEGHGNSRVLAAE